MRYVSVTSTQDQVPANILDPEPYLRELPALQVQLPAGARTFATDPDHYDFSSVRCVKDLRFEHVTVREAGHAKLTVELALTPNRFKHLSGLVIRYVGVAGIEISADAQAANTRVWPDSPKLGDVQLDEILPVVGGCTHEIKMTGGSVMITCEDLQAEWGSTPTE